VSRFSKEEKATIKSTVATLTIKRIPDKEIILEIKRQIGKTMTPRTLWNVRQQIKKESHKWYRTMREGEYEYIHEFKERINEINWLQKKHHELITKYPNRPHTIQKSLEELHRLNITLSNYFDVAPSITEAYTTSNNSMNNGNSLSVSSQQDKEIIV
jgi:DNA repair ATPase RecN